MRTTITLPDELFRELKVYAVKSGRTLGSVIEEATGNLLRRGAKPLRPMPVFKSNDKVKIPAFKEVQEQDDLEGAPQWQTKRSSRT